VHFRLIYFWRLLATFGDFCNGNRKVAKLSHSQNGLKMYVVVVFKFSAVFTLQHEGKIEIMQKTRPKKIAKSTFWTFLKCPFPNF
jgi:chromatin segregation and condensation protein Rec8/ScpA/Scc1 (kleisin family)